MGFQGSRLVFHGLRWILLVTQGSRVAFPGGFYSFSRFQVSFFYCSRSVFMVFQGSRFVFHGSKWVFIVFQGFRLVFRGSRWETLRTPKRYSPHLYLGPTIPLGLAGRLWPSDDDDEDDDDDKKEEVGCRPHFKQSTPIFTQ